MPAVIGDNPVHIEKPRSRLRARFDEMIAALGLGAASSPKTTLLVVLATVIFCGLQIPTLPFVSSPDLYLNEDKPARIVYDEMRAQFGRDDLVFVAITPPNGGKVFELEFMEQLRELHHRLEMELPWVDEVQSLVTARLTRVIEDGLVVGELMEEWPADSAAVAELERIALDQPLYRNLYLSNDGKTTGIVVRPLTYPEISDADALAGFDDEEEPPIPGKEQEFEFIQYEEMNQLASKLSEILADFDFRGAEVHAVGIPVLNTELQLDVMTDMAMFSGISILVIGLLLWFVFRRGVAVALPLMTVACATTITLGLMAFFGRPMTMVSQIVPPFILAVGVGFAVHLLAIYFQRLDHGEEYDTATSTALKHAGPAIVMSAMTTAFGMASFMSSDLMPVRDVGIFVPVGVMVAAFLALTLVPSVLALIRVEPREIRTTDKERQPLTERTLVACAQFGIRRPVTVVLLTLTVLLGAASAIHTIPPGYNILDWISDDGPYSQGTLAVNTSLGGAGNMEIIVDTGEENGLYEPQWLRKIDAIQRYLEENPGEQFSFQKTSSISDVVKEIHRALNEGREDSYVIPDDRQLIAQELLLFENSGSDDLEQLVDSGFRKARISAKGEHADGAEYLEYLNTHIPELREIAGEMKLAITGLLHLNAYVVRLVVETAVNSYVIAFLLITPVMIVFIGSIRSGIVSLAPNLIPIAIVLGVMGWAQTPLDIFTALIGGIALGLVVDDTLHILHAFRVYYAQLGDFNMAITRTMETTGRAILFTTLVLTSGFAIYGFATAQSVVAFGLLTALAVLLAFFLDLVLTPALLALVYRNRQVR